MSLKRKKYREENEKQLVKGTLARAYRETPILLRRQKGDGAHRRGSRSMSAAIDSREDLHKIIFVFQQAEFLCDGWNNHITQVARRNGLRKGKGEKKWKSNSTHPNHEKKENFEVTLCSVDCRWRWYVWKWHVLIYGSSIGQRHRFVFFSLGLCSVGHRVSGENSSGRWKWSLVYFLDIVPWNNVAILSPSRLTNIDMFDWVVWFEYSSQTSLSTKIFTIAVWFKSKKIIYQSQLFSTMISIFAHWSITIFIDIVRRRYHNLFNYCLCHVSIGRVRKNEEGI